jgi:prolyl oligopeptidase
MLQPLAYIIETQVNSMSKRIFPSITVILVIILTSGQGNYMASAQERKSPPKTRIDNVTETIHGIEIKDPYRWLEDQDSPETRNWLDQQIKYTQSVLGSVAGRDKIKQRLEQLMKVDVISPPIAAGTRYFLTRRRADQNQAVIYVREGLNGKDEVLIDPNSMSADQTTSVSLLDVSDDGRLIIYGIRQGGEDEMTISLLDVDSRKNLSDRLPKSRYFGISVKPDKSGFYYTRFNPAIGSRVLYHTIGTDPAKDEEIFGSGYGPTQIIDVELSEDGKNLIISVAHGSAADQVEIYHQDIEKKGPITPVVTDVKARFSGVVHNGILYLYTNWAAPNGRLMAVDLKNRARSNWRDVVSETSSVMSGFSLVGGKLCVNYLDKVNSIIKVFDLSGQLKNTIKFPTIGTASGMTGREDKDEAFYVFTSFAQPPTIYRYEVSTGRQEEWARTAVPIKSDEIEVRQVWYKSKDGVNIPMFLIHKKGITLDGRRPTILTGYGGFNVSLTPNFSPQAALWAERGGVYAIANLRGGGEFGEKWHRDGMLQAKQNVFDDFIKAAEYLIKNGYTDSSKLAISGGSNGGLLVGAAMTQRPELFQAVVCAVPLLDMVRYHKFLVAKFWVPEYGSSDDSDQLKYLLAYSPYHNVRPGTKYPAVMFVTGDADTRVAPLHARKMAALMQSATASDRPVLLHYDTKAGHSAGLPVSKQIEDMTDMITFLTWQLGGSMD